MSQWHHTPGQSPSVVPAHAGIQGCVGAPGTGETRDMLLYCDEGDTLLHAVIPAEAGIHG